MDWNVLVKYFEECMMYYEKYFKLLEDYEVEYLFL